MLSIQVSDYGLVKIEQFTGLIDALDALDVLKALKASIAFTAFTPSTAFFTDSLL
jgi:hypothetical protein